MTMSGLRSARSICRRSMWNICAGVDGTHTCMLFSAHSCRKRSRRAEECSGPCAFVAVRQEQREPAQAAPLRFARADELVDDDLRAVDEVAELAFPDHERVRIGGRVAVLEAHHGLFGQHRVDDLERAAAARRCAAAGCSAAPLFWSCSTAWRWKNVPRPLSWPVRRIAKPSSSSAA